MAKLTLTDLTSLSNETSFLNTLNQNFADIETAIENTLSRDGTSPNTMGADLDANSNDINNIADLRCSRLFIDGSQLASLSQMQTYTSDAQDAATEAENWANYAEDSLVPEGNGVDEYSAYHWAQKADGHATDAENAAAGVNLPSITSGDADKFLQVKDDESGYELTAPADQSTAEAGTNNTDLMTPLRTDQYTTARLATQAEAEGGSNSTQLMTPERTQQWYDAQISNDRVVLGGGFDAGEEIVCERIGNTVTITSVGALDHTALFEPSSDTGAIPSKYRPSCYVRNIAEVDNSKIVQVIINPDGTFAVNYHDWSGSGTAPASTNGAVTITYVVESDV